MNMYTQMSGHETPLQARELSKEEQAFQARIDAGIFGRLTLVK